MKSGLVINPALGAFKVCQGKFLVIVVAMCATPDVGRQGLNTQTMVWDVSSDVKGSEGFFFLKTKQKKKKMNGMQYIKILEPSKIFSNRIKPITHIQNS